MKQVAQFGHRPRLTRIIIHMHIFVLPRALTAEVLCQEFLSLDECFGHVFCGEDFVRFPCGQIYDFTLVETPISSVVYELNFSLEGPKCLTIR